MLNSSQHAQKYIFRGEPQKKLLDLFLPDFCTAYVYNLLNTIYPLGIFKGYPKTCYFYMKYSCECYVDLH